MKWRRAWNPAFEAASPITQAWHCRLLSPIDLALLRSLPTIDWFEWEGRHFRISHATPQGNLFKYLTPYEHFDGENVTVIRVTYQLPQTIAALRASPLPRSEVRHLELVLSLEAAGNVDD